MDLTPLNKHYRAVQLTVGVARRAEVEEAVSKLVEDEEWDLCGILIASASELGARVLVARLLEHKVYAPLAYAATMRRQVKEVTHQQRPGQTRRRVFRDIDTETEEKAIPDHIRAEMDDLQTMAEESRFIADRREAERDACPIRALIVNELGTAMVGSPEAMEALLAIVRASAWEDTRRSAALKLLTHEPVLKKLDAADRIDDMVTIANSCALESACEKIAAVLGPRADSLVANRKRQALRLISRYHSDPDVRAKAAGALS